MDSNEGAAGFRRQVIESYNELFARGYFGDGIGGNEQYLGRLMNHYVPTDATSVLEVGSASGLWLRQVLASRPALREVTAVEISDAALACRDRLEPALRTRPGSALRVVQADFLTELPRLPAADVVVSSFVAEYMGEVPTYLDRLFGLARPGGTVIVVDVLTSRSAPAGATGVVPLVGSFLRLCAAHVRNGLLPPVSGVVRALPLHRFTSEPAFRALHDSFTGRYSFPRSEWAHQARRFPGSVFHHLGIAGMLVLRKPG